MPDHVQNPSSRSIPGLARRVRHLRRGTTYTVVGTAPAPDTGSTVAEGDMLKVFMEPGGPVALLPPGVTDPRLVEHHGFVGMAELQVSGPPPVPGELLVIYRGDDKKLWARPQSEFDDGRFEDIKPGAPVGVPPFHPRHGRIVAAAIRGPDGEVFSLPPPARHNDIAQQFGLNPEERAKGFLTDRGVWVDRRRALSAADASGQVVKGPMAPAHGLYTDDLW